MSDNISKVSTVLAVKSVQSELQTLAERAAKLEVDKIMPISDSVLTNFGPDIARDFNDRATNTVRECVLSIREAKETISQLIVELEAVVSGKPIPSDMSQDDGIEAVEYDEVEVDTSEVDTSEVDTSEQDDSHEDTPDEASVDDPEEDLDAIFAEVPDSRPRNESFAYEVLTKIDSYLTEGHNAFLSIAKASKDIGISTDEAVSIFKGKL